MHIKVPEDVSDEPSEATGGVAMHNGASVDLIVYLCKIVASESKFDEEGWNF